MKPQLLLYFLFLSIASPVFAQTPQIKNIEVYHIPSSIRALKVVDHKTVWFAGSSGVYGFTRDGGQTWYIDSITNGPDKPDFRSIAVTRNALFLLSAGSPALLYKSTDQGRNWRLVYQNTDPKVFYDAMAFWNDEEGIAIGDPMDTCLSIIITRNGGESWEKVSCKILPAAVEGEAAFAASNSNIAIVGNHVWVVTGGKNARVFHSPDKGKIWDVYGTPVIQGDQMTGIFSVDFWDEDHGIIIGGDWNNKEGNVRNKAATEDGGKTWELVAMGEEPGYRSCIKFFPDGKGQEIIAAGIPGISYSADGGKSWIKLSNESYYTLDFGKNRKTIWLAGKGKIGRMELKTF